MIDIELKVLGIPKGQPRTKAYNRGKHAGVYTPTTADAWKECVMIAAKPELLEAPIDEPLIVKADFYMPRPKRLLRKMDPEGAVPHIGTPDIDNLVKSTFDALTEIGMWRDDALVFDCHAVKWHTGKVQRTGARITIRSLDRRATAPREMATRETA